MILSPWQTQIIVGMWSSPLPDDVLTDLMKLPQRLEDVASDQHYPSDLFSQAKESNLEHIDRFKYQVVIPSFAHALDVMFKEDLLTYDYQIIGWTVGSLEPTHHIPRQLHSHPEAILSAVFYVYAPLNMDGGVLTCYDPRWNAERGYPSSMKHAFEPMDIIPATGRSVVIPSYVHHAIQPYTGARVAIAADLIIVQDYKETVKQFRDGK